MSTESKEFTDLSTQEAESITGGAAMEIAAPLAMMLSEPEVVVEP